MKVGNYGGRVQAPTFYTGGATRWLLRAVGTVGEKPTPYPAAPQRSSFSQPRAFLSPASPPLRGKPEERSLWGP